MNKQIGWSQESNLLYQISALITRLTQVTAANSGGGMAIGGAITSATEGSILFAGALGVLQQDNANLFWDDTNNRLGIKTTSPAYTLDVNGITKTSALEVWSQFPVTQYFRNATGTTTYAGIVAYGNATGINFDYTNTFFFRSGISGTSVFGLFATGNLVLQNGGTFTDAGYRLDVNGTARVSGALTTGNTITVGFQLYVDLIRPKTNTTELTIYTSHASTYGVTFWQSFNDTDNYTTGTRSLIRAGITFNPTSGTAVRNQLLIDPIINQTGGASGISRGLFVNPTLTAAADFRAIEWTSNTGWGLYGSGTADNFIGGGLLVNGVFRETTTTNRQTVSYTLAIADRGKLVEMNVSTANNLTIPLDSAVAFPIGTKIEVAQYGAGQTTIVATGGVTIRSASGNLKIASQYVAVSLIKIGTNEWYCFGNLSA